MPSHSTFTNTIRERLKAKGLSDQILDSVILPTETLDQAQEAQKADQRGDKRDGGKPRFNKAAHPKQQGGMKMATPENGPQATYHPPPQAGPPQPPPGSSNFDTTEAAKQAFMGQIFQNGPAAVGKVLQNIAAGKTPIKLGPSAGDAALQEAVRWGVRGIITTAVVGGSSLIVKKVFFPAAG